MSSQIPYSLAEFNYGTTVFQTLTNPTLDYKGLSRDYSAIRQLFPP